MHIANFLSKRAYLTPNREALLELESGNRFTYSKLNSRANRLGNLMRDKLNVGKGDRVAILANNDLAYIDLIFGLAKIGAVFAPLNWRLTPGELEYIINNCRPKVILVSADYEGVIRQIRSGINVETIISLKGANFEGSLVYETELESASDKEPECPFIDGETPSFILYTSGTTGKPKGAVIPHRQVLWNCINTVATWGITEEDISPIFTPLFHAGGLFAFLTPLFYLGGRIVLAKEFDIEESLAVIEREKCTVVLGVPTIYQLWANSSRFKKADFSCVRRFFTGGAACPEPLMDIWREEKNVIFRQGYGLTEVGPNCFSITDEETVRKPGSIGKPVFHASMRIVDAELNDVPNGEIGELLISGPMVFSHYWENEHATGSSFEGNWFRTGDMVRKDNEGFFFVAGRAKDMIISGGENIYSAEVEAVFHDHASVAEASLIGKPDKKWGEIGLIVVVLKNGMSATEDELKAFCQKRLAKYKTPKQIIFANDLPHTAMGKVIKQELRARYL